MGKNALIKAILARSALLGALWGFAEGTVFFVVPDVLISFVALFSFRRFLWCALASMLGAVIAGATLFWLASHRPDLAIAIVRAVPFVTPRMIASVEADYLRYGLWAVFAGPIAGIPYKIYAAEAPAHVGILPFLLVSMPARLVRFVLVGSVSFIIRRIFFPSAEESSRKLVVGHAICWGAFYAFYWYRVGHI